MVTLAEDPVLQALLASAVQMTGAETGILLRHEGETLRVVGTLGDAAHPVRDATTPVHAGVAAYVMASGQPLALSVRPGDPRLAEGVTALLARPPTTVLCVPCATEEDTVGALLLLDKRAGQFTFDDVEFATVLAGIAGVALAADTGGGASVPEPAELAGELQRLHRSDPARYRMVAVILEALLARG